MLPNEYKSSDSFEIGPELPSAAGRPDVSVFGALNILLRQWLLVGGVTLATVIVVVVIVLATPRSYSSQMSFAAGSRKGQAPGASIAAQFGIALPGADATRPPQFYVDLLHSREILGPVVDSTYEFELNGNATRQNLIPLYGRNKDAVRKRLEAIERLGASLTAGISSKTNVITLTVKSPSPTLSFKLGLAILNELNAFNQNDRQAQASAERRFTEQLMNESETRLRAAEERQAQFLESRQYETSPRRTLERDRLNRDVSVRQQVYTSLAQAADQAKIEEVRDTPFLSIVERPAVPVLPDSRGGVPKVIMALFGGFLLGALLAVARDLATHSRGQPNQEREEFDLLRKHIAHQLRHPVQTLLGRR